AAIFEKMAGTFQYNRRAPPRDAPVMHGDVISGLAAANIERKLGKTHLVARVVRGNDFKSRFHGDWGIGHKGHWVLRLYHDAAGILDASGGVKACPERRKRRGQLKRTFRLAIDLDD